MLHVASVTLLCLVMPAPGWAAAPAPLSAKRGMVAADQQLASRAGVSILRRGGNAVDAACATAFALGVVNPAGSGVGGGGFMLVELPGGAVHVLDFREIAPAAATADMYQKPGVAKHASRVGGLAIGVPGEVAGCAEAVRRWGKLPLRRVVAPAVRLARRGFPLGLHLAHSIERSEKKIRARPQLARMFLPGGKLPSVGQRMRRPRLARTLSAIGRRGPKVFYRGWIARDIVKAAHAAGGILTRADLAGYAPKLRKPLHTSYAGHDIYTMPPPSSGGVAIIETLNILRRFSLAKRGHNSSRYLHVVTEALKHAFADRARFLGDTDFVKVPVERLISQSYADRLKRRIGKHTLAIEKYGDRSAARAPLRDGGTSHLSVVDRKGMAVAMTTTINYGFGSLVVAPRSGVILNDEMDDFAARPGKPNVFGLIQSKHNRVQPRKRPLSSMSPTIVVKGGKPRLVLGASGGPTIITGTLQVMLNVLVFDLDVADAVCRSRIHHQWLPDKLWVESDLPRDVTDNLKKRGHRLRRVKHPFTAVQAVRVVGDALHGASDPRKHGHPAGW